MKTHPIYIKALTTNKITKNEATLYFSDLYKLTDAYMHANHKFYVNGGMWPLRARLAGKAQKDPKFIVNHCTGSVNRTHGGALARFFQSEMASAHFIITDKGEILYLVPLVDMAYHATKRAGIIPFSIAKLLGITDGKWLNEPGIEIVGSGNAKLFTPEALEASVVLQRLIVAYFGGSVTELKSHRYFSPVDRSGDPGALYFLPLVEHAVFNDVDVRDSSYWLENYRSNQVEFAKGVDFWFGKYKVTEKDEWAAKRKKMQITGQMML
jgi:hypothetical protein